jgi:hypothetical protein
MKLQELWLTMKALPMRCYKTMSMH